MLVASGVTLALGEVVDGSVIFGVVFVLAVIGYIQETKAEDAIRALTKMLVTEATVRRDGRKQRVRSIELVPGDVVLLQSGDRVPADLRLVRLRSLRDRRIDVDGRVAASAQTRQSSRAGNRAGRSQESRVRWDVGNPGRSRTESFARPATKLKPAGSRG